MENKWAETLSLDIIFQALTKSVAVVHKVDKIKYNHLIINENRQWFI